MEQTKGCEGTNLMTRDMKEQNHMIGRNKNKNMLEQKPKEQKHMIGKQQIQYHIGTTYVTAWNINNNTLEQN
jgi:hypothetical protein